MIMTDTRTPEQRRRIMQSVKGKNTGPEKAVRHLLYSQGYRYRIHYKKLPGRPDIVFPGKKKAIFVHGCFWHNHGCDKGKAPKSRPEFWQPKMKANRERDASQVSDIEALGWSVLTVWQCDLRTPEELGERLTRFLAEDSEVRSTNGEQSASL
jgi:DNA mismatch endonuclease (patch repair protein)